MTRPSKHTDELMIEAAKSLIREKGISGLKVREAAQKAGVNLGMFHYHFKTKDEFIRRVLLAIYDEFYADFAVETGGNAPPVERLRRALVSIARFARRNRPVALAIVSDLMRGHKPTVDFAVKNFTRHIFAAIGIIRECQREGSIADVPLPQAAVFLAGSIIFPTAVVGVLEKAGAGTVMGLARPALEKAVLSDEAIEARIDWALGALRPKR